jgi:hypothetical protein
MRQNGRRQKTTTEHVFTWTFGLSAFLELLGCFVCSYYLLFETKKTHVYSFYRTRVVGDRVPVAGLANKSAGLANQSAGLTNQSFILGLEQAYARTCPQKPDTIEGLLILDTSFDAKLDLENLVQTWMPVTYHLFGLPNFNGYFMLLTVFVVSTVAQLYFVRQKVDFFKEPCWERWLEYALTSPLQVVLIAGCVMIRDASTITFVFVAQLVCVLLGFPLECALQNERLMRALETVLEKNAQVASQIEIEFSSSSQTEKAPVEIQETAKLVVQIAPQTLISYGRICSHRVWWLCMFASSVLHVAVWYVIIIQLSHVESEARCYKESAGWRDALRIVIYGQCGLFTLFAVVPPVQKIFLNSNVRDAFLYGSVAYALLSVVAKTFLGASYIAFVALFPFKTSNITLI